MRALLIINLGTPAEPTAKGLRDYYRYFFADPYVFDIPAIGRWLLRNLIIMPFRAPRTAKNYASIWLKDGSPLKVYTEQLCDSLQDKLDPSRGRILVRIGMGYSEPFITDALEELEARGVDDILVLPLFPQYSTATTGSVLNAVRTAVSRWPAAPRVRVIEYLFNEPAFIRAWTELISKHLPQDDPARRVEHVVFSYHGLPEKNLRKADKNAYCRFDDCCDSITDNNRYCYRAQCMDTTRSIVAALGWEPGYYSVAFQSRFGREPWIQPYLDEHIEKLAASGLKRIAVATPSFVSDCLETLHEIGIEYRELFLEKGGEELLLIPNLNNEPCWFRAAAEIVERHLSRSVILASG